METIISILAGLVGVPIVQFLKKRFNIVDEMAVLLTLGVSVALGIFALWVDGQITGASFAVDQLNTTVGITLSTAFLVYRLIVKPQTLA